MRLFSVTGVHCRAGVFQRLWAVVQKDRTAILVVEDSALIRMDAVDAAERAGFTVFEAGNADQAKEALDLGLMISFSGIVTFKNADALRAAAKGVPRG